MYFPESEFLSSQKFTKDKVEGYKRIVRHYNACKCIFESYPRLKE